MVEGLWTVVFRAGQISAGGVVVLQSGKIIGGDSQYYYIGTYSESGGRITATIRVQAFITNAVSVFGMPVGFFDLNLAGTINGNQGSASATTSTFPGLRLNMNLVRRA